MKENGDGSGEHFCGCIIGLAALGRWSANGCETSERELQTGQEMRQGEGSSL